MLRSRNRSGREAKQDGPAFTPHAAGMASQVALPPAAALEAGIGIVHLGLGAFHRAHQAILTQRALAVAPGPWAISGASLRGAAVRDALRPQDCLYTLVENDGADERASVVGVIREALFAPEEEQLLLARLAAPSTRIVTLTVTEKGYCHNPATGELDLAHPDIRADLARRGPAALDARLARARARARGEPRGPAGSPCSAATTWRATAARCTVSSGSSPSVSTVTSPPGSRTRSASRAAWSTGSSRPRRRPRSTTRRASWACATRRR